MDAADSDAVDGAGDASELGAAGLHGWVAGSDSSSMSSLSAMLISSLSAVSMFWGASMFPDVLQRKGRAILI